MYLLTGLNGEKTISTIGAFFSTTSYVPSQDYSRYHSKYDKTIKISHDEKDFDTIYKKTPFLKKIVFYSDSDIKGAKLKIRLFDFNDTIPTNDLLSEDLIVTVKKGMRKNVIDISEYNLRFPEKGIVVGLEWMIIEENRHDFVYKDQSKKTVTMENYQPSLVVNYSKEEDSFNYSQGKWARSKIFITDQKDKPWFNTVMLPAINLILTN
jgi:hypothetical protein